ncbi:MAG: hypothetical protein LBU60_05495 [Clostridiales bacterium]|jgi:hypothetical protein|nr:hypothetical protein [Clostridiales bacterium]
MLKKKASLMTKMLIAVLVLVLPISAVVASMLNTKSGMAAEAPQLMQKQFEKKLSQSKLYNEVLGDNALDQKLVYSGLVDLDSIVNYFNNLSAIIDELLKNTNTDDIAVLQSITQKNNTDNDGQSSRGTGFLGIRMSRSDMYNFIGNVDGYFTYLSMAELAAVAAQFVLVGTAYFAVFTAWINVILVIGNIVYGILVAMAATILGFLIWSYIEGFNNIEFGVRYNTFLGVPTGGFEFVNDRW